MFISPLRTHQHFLTFQCPAIRNLGIYRQQTHTQKKDSKVKDAFKPSQKQCYQYNIQTQIYFSFHHGIPTYIQTKVKTKSKLNFDDLSGPAAFHWIMASKILTTTSL